MDKYVRLNSQIHYGVSILLVCIYRTDGFTNSFLTQQCHILINAYILLISSTKIDVDTRYITRNSYWRFIIPDILQDYYFKWRHQMNKYLYEIIDS